jgi:high affinity sulfate transporter 1
MPAAPRSDVRGPDYVDREPFSPANDDSLLQRAVPVAKEIPEYQPRTGGRDCLAGLTVAALAIPSAMAYAELAGVNAIHGLYTILLPCVAYTLLGSSRQLIVGPGGSLAAMVAAAVLPLAAAGSPHAARLAATLALLCGCWYLIACALRLGWVADYISRPVIVGYIHGVVITVIVSQLGVMLGLEIHAHKTIPQIAEAIRHIGDANGDTVILSVILLVILIPTSYLAPRFPAALLVIIASILASKGLDLQAHGVATVGHIPAGLPGVALPDLSIDTIGRFAPVAFGIFLVSFADEVLTARTFAGRHNQSIRVNQELLAMGAANLAAGVTHGIPVGASESRTAVNDSMGARTQVAGLWAVLAAVLVLLFLTGPIAYLPNAVLGAVIIAAVLAIVNPQAWRSLWETDHVEVTIAAVTTAGVVIVGILNAVVFAVGLSIIDVVRRSAHPHDAVLGWDEQEERWADVSVHRSARVEPGVVVYRLDDRLFFANADYVKGRVFEALRAAPTPARAVVFDAESVTHVDTAGLDALVELVDQLQAAEVEFRFADVKDHVFVMLNSGGTAERIGLEHFYPTITAAVRA